jgi:RNA polymerase sigma-70 factor (ECF subfamily)
VEGLDSPPAGDRVDVRMTERWWEAHLDDLRRAAARLADSPDECDELVQETLIAALKNADQVKQPELMGAWLVQILRHKRYDQLRRRALERRVPAPSRPAREDFDRERVRRVLDRLGPEDRRAVEMRYFEGRTSAQIAARLRKPAGTVRATLFRALRKFEALYRESLAGDLQ